MNSIRKEKGPQRPPATTLEGREKQLIALATDVAEEQLRSGKASSQVITHYLKLGTTREVLEQDRLRNENELLQAKVKNMVSVEKINELYELAIAAMREYTTGREEVIDEQILQ